MSKTQHKNAAKIWDALVEMSSIKGDMWYQRQWWSVGEIAKAAGVSKPTVRKYLDMAVEQECALKVFWNNQTQYRVFSVLED